MVARASSAKKSTKAKSARGPGQPRYQPTDDHRAAVQRLKFTGHCTDAEIAAILGISEPTLRKYYADDLALSRKRLLGDIGASLYAKAMAGDTTAMIFILKTQAGWRETNRTELTGADGAPLEAGMSLPPLVMVEFVDAPSEDGDANPQPA